MNGPAHQLREWGLFITLEPFRHYSGSGPFTDNQRRCSLACSGRLVLRIASWATTHDYISVAILFDNGQDMSYVWSSELAEGTVFRCPLPDSNARETHLVIRSDPSEIGQWLREERNISADYERYIGGPMPKRITQVWLIANTAFQGGTGTARVANISIGDSSAKASREKVF